MTFLKIPAASCTMVCGGYVVSGCVTTSDSEPPMLQAIHCDNTDRIQIVIVHNLDLLPGYQPGLTFQKAKTYRTHVTLHLQ